MTVSSKLGSIIDFTINWYDSTLASIHSCQFCKIQDGYVKRIATSGTYYSSGWRHYYHPECVERVMADPEKYGHKLTDLALFISQRLSERKAWEEKEEQKQEKMRICREAQTDLARQYKNRFKLL